MKNPGLISLVLAIFNSTPQRNKVVGQFIAKRRPTEAPSGVRPEILGGLPLVF